MRKMKLRGMSSFAYPTYLATAQLSCRPIFQGPVHRKLKACIQDLIKKKVVEQDPVCSGEENLTSLADCNIDVV